MSEPEKITRERAKELTKQIIIDHGKKEFLKHGYLNVSVRSLAKSANLTSGAIYTHFKDKAELFMSLVRPALAALLDLLKEVHEEKLSLIQGGKSRPQLGIKLEDLKAIIGNIYEHFVEFRLLMVASAGSGQENFLFSISQFHSECLERCLDALKKSDSEAKRADMELIRVLSYSYFTAIFEVVGRNLPRERADQLVSPLFQFFEPGWNRLLSLSSD
ncbi:MAG: TetR/AcrR family transcriptional regulator [Deltaproteobacteria bacterium]|jgi:AcrR family transcriptional regulator|nr:TetR/AcrR family transcriptional regulator [Deltaproteobacteria bacterium]